MGGNKRYKDQPASVPAWAATVGLMKANQVQVRATCTECGYHKEGVDLDAIIERKGADYSLFDARPPCPGRGCTSRVFFMYSPGGATPMRKCSTSRA